MSDPSEVVAESSRVGLLRFPDVWRAGRALPQAGGRADLLGRRGIILMGEGTVTPASGSAAGGGRRRTLRVAVEGCAHGELDMVYRRVNEMERDDGRKVDLLICCGDFQAVRNTWDLECMACPRKYRAMHSFWKYYAGVLRAPVLTIFIGGNHEASNHLWELPFGGWVAPNIYYLGDAGVVRFGGLRLAGLSGIYNARNYAALKYERPPYDEATLRSSFHVRRFDVDRLMQLARESRSIEPHTPAGSPPLKRPRESDEADAPLGDAPWRLPVDIFISHDWPRRIAEFGNTAALLKRKSFLAREIAEGTLGSPPAMALLRALQPAWWFSAHMHVRFEAYVPHTPSAGGSNSPAGGRAAPRRATRFLALDKCLEKRPFLEIMDFDVDAEVDETGALVPPYLEYDDEWLAVTRAWHPLRTVAALGGRDWEPPEGPPPAIEQHLAYVRGRFDELGKYSRRISEFSFFRTQPIYDPRFESLGQNEKRRVLNALQGLQVRSPTDNPQTISMLKFLGLPLDPADFFVEPRKRSTSFKVEAPPFTPQQATNAAAHGASATGASSSSGMALKVEAPPFQPKPAALTAAIAMAGGMLPRTLTNPTVPHTLASRGPASGAPRYSP